jgi:molybdopterin synthase sulfur carrier subunit
MPMSDQVSVLYFASLREQLGCDREDLQLTDELSTLEDVQRHLAERQGSWQVVFGGSANILSAVNQQMARADTAIKAGDEVAFFPPVTGG